MSEKDIKKLQRIISDLENENSKLKKQLSQYKKYVNRSADIILDNYEMCQELGQKEKKEKIKICENCGKGETHKIKILNITFEICQLCQNRKKVK